MKHRNLNRIIASAVFFVTEAVYLATMAPTLSFWDCGEFIATSNTLGIPHPPGAPLFLLFGRLFSMLPLPLDPGAKVNLISTIMSALTVMLTYLTTVRLIVMYRRQDADSWTPAGKISAYGGAIVGALALAFSESFWFNAVEAEVYAASSLFTVAVIWMMLRWHEEEPEPGNERWILGVMYLFGLSIGVHLLCLLAVFCIAMIYYFKKYEPSLKSFALMLLVSSLLFILVYKVIVVGLPILLKSSSWWGFLFVLAVLVGAAWYAHRERLVLINTICMSLLLIIIGYTSYTTIYVRAQAAPPINENDPSTMEAFSSYLNRDQYGEMPLWPRRWSPEPLHRYFYDRYDSELDYFLTYQLGHMYLRYFGWQFIGRQHDAEGAPVDWTVLWGLPFMLGAAGAVNHFRRQWPMALVITVLFFMTGAALVIYLNQTQPQPRERDYSYVGSFIAFALWIGIGVESLFTGISSRMQRMGQKQGVLLAAGIVAAGVLLVDGRMLQANYRTHDRSGNYVPWDWAWNILQSCDRDAILFTNGDNDTFPLWYLQEVERIRTDVRVVNLSLANTGWYLLQLKHESPRGARPIEFSFSDEEIANINYMPVDSMEVAVPAVTEQRRLLEDARHSASRLPGVPSDSLQWRLLPGISYKGQGYLRPQDIAVFDIVASNYGRRPIYFVLTVDPEGMIGLDRNLRLDGMVYRVVPMRSASPMSFLDPEILYRNLFRTYRYRNLGNQKVYIEQTGRDLAGNYRPLFTRLALDLASTPAAPLKVPGPAGLSVEMQRGRLAVDVLDRAEALFPLERFPVTPELAASVVSIYAGQGVKQKAYPYIKYLETLASQSDEQRDPALFITLARAYRAMGRDQESGAVFGRLKRALPEMSRQLDSLMQ
ncbi:MAG: DUF2723 domain-containing protein [Chlorobiaceae bacterium]|nr:DUF2723 domain-containing protein [Chlorobiaceae bacterium]NTW73661.1 DUF2723 domain-containing protein [Chlorobiaceae bacterium]